MYTDHFGIENIPFGIASSASHPKKGVATRFEDTVIFLDELAKLGHLNISAHAVKTFSEPTLNSFAALTKAEQKATRVWIQSYISKSLPPSCCTPLAKCTLHLPVSVGDFTDFSCSRDHVLNAGEAVFKKRELPPGFEHFPIGYHGRASSIVVSGTPIPRPKGQYRDQDGKVVFGPTKRLDYELEVAAVIGKPSVLGEPINIANADDHIFGLVLINDWSARDIQGLEMNPLGPLNGKSFATSISPWVITLDALETFKVSLPPRNPGVTIASYLQDPDTKPTFDFELKASIRPQHSKDDSVTCMSKFSSLYWTLRDLIAHQTINGCSLRTGDLLATGTISGSTLDSHGCLMEIATKGGVDVKNSEGAKEKRIFLEDGDRVTLNAIAGQGVGFGECEGTVIPAR